MPWGGWPDVLRLRRRPFSGLCVTFTTFLCSVWEDQLPPEAAAVRDTTGTQLPLAMVAGITKGGHGVTTNPASAWGPSKETYGRTRVADALTRSGHGSHPILPASLLTLCQPLPAWRHQSHPGLLQFSHALLPILAWTMQLPYLAYSRSSWLTPLRFWVSTLPQTLGLD